MKRRTVESIFVVNVSLWVLLILSSRPTELHRVGYWLTDVKLRMYNISQFTHTCRNAGIDLVPIDLSVDLEAQGPFDAMLHDVNDLITQEDYATVISQIHALQEYCTRHPGTAVVNPLENIDRLQQRNEMYTILRQAAHRVSDLAFDIPPFVEFKSRDIATNKQLMKQYQIQYPFGLLVSQENNLSNFHSSRQSYNRSGNHNHPISNCRNTEVCKPSVAHGTSFCHKMQVIFNDTGLGDVNAPCVAQTFIDHNAVLYKVYVIDHVFFVMERPSLKNLKAGQFDTIYFHSHSVSKPHSSSYLNEIHAELPSEGPDPSALQQLVNELHDHLGLALFGFDIIVEKNSGTYNIIDINPFPTYEGVPQFTSLLLQLLQKTLAAKHNT